MKDINDIIAKLEELKTDLRVERLRADKEQARINAEISAKELELFTLETGLSIGDLVISKGSRYFIHKPDYRDFQGKWWIIGRKIKIDGGNSKRTENLYSSWEKLNKHN